MTGQSAGRGVIDEIQALLDPLREMHRWHHEALDEHRTAEGDAIEKQYAEYEETRHTTAIEASDTLDTVIQRLELLVATPARRAFTIALNGTGHAEGESPWLFVVNAPDLDDAQRCLTQLPSYKRWLADIRTPDDTSPLSAADIVADQSHPGTRAPGTYIDLRHEQAGILADRTGRRHTSPIPASGPPCAARPRSR